MLRLLLLRHAKSVPGDPGEPDIDRPLGPRGRRSAPLIGQHMATHKLVPDLVLCSPARRTRETLAGILPYLPGEMTIRIAGALYEPREGNYLDSIGKAGEGAQTLLVIGHNPATQETASRLVGFGNPDLRAEVATRFPTAGLAVIDLDQASWGKLGQGTGRIVAFFRPRDLEVVGGGEPGDDD